MFVFALRSMGAPAGGADRATSTTAAALRERPEAAAHTTHSRGPGAAGRRSRRAVACLHIRPMYAEGRRRRVNMAGLALHLEVAGPDSNRPLPAVSYDDERQ